MTSSMKWEEWYQGVYFFFLMRIKCNKGDEGDNMTENFLDF